MCRRSPFGVPFICIPSYHYTIINDRRMSSSFHRRKSIPKRDWNTMAVSASPSSNCMLQAAQDGRTVYRTPSSLITSLVPASSSTLADSDTHAVVAASSPVAPTTLNDAAISLLHRAFDHVASSSISQMPNLHALGIIYRIITMLCIAPIRRALDLL